VSVFGQTREVRDDDATILTVLNLLPGLIYHFDDDMALGDVMVAGDIAAGDCE